MHTQSFIGSVTTGDRLIDGQSWLHANCHLRQRRCRLFLIFFFVCVLSRLVSFSPRTFWYVVIVNLIVQCETEKAVLHIVC